MSKNLVILGAGVSGLAAGLNTPVPIFEASACPGGISLSYYSLPGGNRAICRSTLERAYRFEIGGGHWIFGGDTSVLSLIRRLAPTKTYKRDSVIYFAQTGHYAGFPIQNHLADLPREVAAQALLEMTRSGSKDCPTMAEWLDDHFGPTLCKLFFDPFHEKYTAGLFTEIAPQDSYKSPFRLKDVVWGALVEAAVAGYNATFEYPADGLDKLINELARRCNVHYEKRIEHIDPLKKILFFSGAGSVSYDLIISTIPLVKMVELTGLDGREPAVYSSVLVINIGGSRGRRCPDNHWLYVPDSRTGFYRVGFYSNVDASFLPAVSRTRKDRVAIYVEMAFRGGQRPTRENIDHLCQTVVKELQDWEFIGDIEVMDPTWVDVAYTWKRPGCQWKEHALKVLEGHGIYQVGRYGRWEFQGIADSIRDGLMVGGAVRNTALS